MKNQIVKIIQEAIKTFQRFPIEMIIAIVGTSTAIYIVGMYNERIFGLENLLHTCFLGVTPVLSASIFAERQKWDLKKKWGLLGFVVLLLVGYYFYLPMENLPAVYWIRAFLLVLAFHLLVSFAAFTGKGELIGFWEYNKQLFVNIIVSGLYSGVLFVGLALAIAAVEQLFKINFQNEIYPRLFFFLLGIFNTWFFLSRFPRNYEALETNIEYPKGLKLFTQFVLLPLVVIYLAILYVYELKIVAQWELPMGWVSYLVLAFSIAGVLALLLVYPLQNSSENKWVKVFTRSFYWALFPLIALFGVAIGKRIMDYGITENRYFLIVLALWLMGTAIYLLVDKLRNIKIIPISLSIVAILSLIGPWSAFSVSERSQFARLKNILKENNLLENNKIKPATDTVSFEMEKEISSIVNYLVEIHGAYSLESLFTQHIDSIIDSENSQYMQADNILKAMNLRYVSRWELEENQYFLYYNSDFTILKLNDFDYFIELNSSLSQYNEKTEVYQQTFSDSAFTLVSEQKNNVLNLIIASDMLRFDMNELLKNLYKKYSLNSSNIPLRELSFFKKNANYEFQVFFTSISGYKSKTKYDVNSYSAKILIKLKEE